MTRQISVLCATLLVPALALAQPKTAEEYYKEGETQYNLGNFKGAIDAFKKGYEAEPNESKKAAYLYNIGQAYRQDKDCGNAVFFYKRYLALKDQDTKKPLKPDVRAEIEARIKELDECAKQQEAIRNKPPDQNLRPGDDTKPDDNGNGTGTTNPPDKQVGDTTGGGDDTPDEPEDGDVSDGTTTEGPSVVSLRVIGGGAKLTTGDLAVPVQATVQLLGGYPLAINDQLRLELGAGFAYTPVPFESTTTMESKTASLLGLVANVAAAYEVIPKLDIRGELGVGGQWFAGASESPFTAGAPTSGALPMLLVRTGVSADYAITPNFVATVAPIAFSYSPAPKGLRDDIKSITAIDFMVGVGYRM